VKQHPRWYYGKSPKFYFLGLIWPLRGPLKKVKVDTKGDWFTLALNQGLEKCFGGGGVCVEFLLNGDKKGFGA